MSAESRLPGRALVLCGLAALVILTVATYGCSQAQKPHVIYADGSRGCKESEKPVAVWDRAGAATTGGVEVGDIPHATRLKVQEEAIRFGVTYFLVEHHGIRGWMPINYTETVVPACA